MQLNNTDVEAISTPSQIVTPKKHKQRKESDRDEMTALNKKIDQISNCLNEMSEIVKKLEKNSHLPEVSSKEKENPKKKEVEHQCLFESNASDMKNRQTIFVKGFDCSFPMDDIKSSLRKHFSSCGEVSEIFIPFECKTGSPLGFGFINMRNDINLIKDAEKALALNRSYLGGMRLEVTMAIKRSEYYGYTNRRGCERCRNAAMKYRRKRFYEGSITRIPPGTVFE